MRKDSFFDGVKEFVEFEKLFVHVDGCGLELLDFLGAVGEDESQGRVGRRWRGKREAPPADDRERDEVVVIG